MKKSCLIRLIQVSFLIVLPICQSQRIVQIINPRITLDPVGVKTAGEAELCFFTESLGFVDDKYQQLSTPWHNILQQFLLTYNVGSETFDTKITKNYFSRNKKNLCSIYLSDPIFMENNIFSYTESRHKYDITYEGKLLKFQYFSREIETVKVIQCPVLVYGYLTHLYFQEVNISSDPMIEGLRGYFVFVNGDPIIESDKEFHPLQILMFTVYNSEQLPDIDETSPEAKKRNTLNPQTNPFKIFITIGAHLSTMPNNKMRVFGENAELLYLTKTYYGFFYYNFELHWRIIKEFLLILERMKSGFEIDSKTMAAEKRRTSANDLCHWYIYYNDHLNERNILPRNPNENDVVSWVTKTVQFPATALLQHGRNRVILQCPVTLGENYHEGHIFILPIHYKWNRQSPQIISFVEHVNDKEILVYPYLMSSTDVRGKIESYFEEGLRQVERTFLDNPEMGDDEGSTSTATLYYYAGN